MGFYEDMRIVAKDLIDEFGVDVVYRSIRTVPSSIPYEPSFEENFDRTVKIAFLPIKKENKQSKYSAGETEQRRGNTKAYMAGGDFQVSAKDVIIRDGRSLRILSVQEIKPASLSVYYEFELDL